MRPVRGAVPGRRDGRDDFFFPPFRFRRPRVKFMDEFEVTDVEVSESTSDVSSSDWDEVLLVFLRPPTSTLRLRRRRCFLGSNTPGRLILLRCDLDMLDTESTRGVEAVDGAADAGATPSFAIILPGHRRERVRGGNDECSWQP